MNWITGVQQALDYIEDHLCEDLDYADIAASACSSSWHFQRIFSILCDMSVGEYIRARRLTKAGSDMASGNERVIDIAMKYRYDSPESFSRAFTRFHGVTPSQAKNSSHELTSFSPLTITLAMKGGTRMNYRIEKRDAFSIIEKVRTFSTKNDEHTQAIPAYWLASRHDDTIPLLCSCASKNEFKDSIMGICHDSNHTDEFEYAIAAVYDKESRIPDGFRIHDIQPATWAVFRCAGSMPEAIQHAWHDIYTEFFPGSEYEPTGELDFELYPKGDLTSSDYESQIWIAVRKKS